MFHRKKFVTQLWTLLPNARSCIFDEKKLDLSVRASVVVADCGCHNEICVLDAITFAAFENLFDWRKYSCGEVEFWSSARALAVIRSSRFERLKRGVGFQILDRAR